MKLKKGYVWKRTGRCQPKKCGAFCCRVGPMMCCVDGKDEERFYKLQGMVPIAKVGKQKIMTHRMSCMALKVLGCGIYKTRPNICKDFPGCPEQKFYRVCKQNGCNYRFVQIKSSKAIKV